MRSEATAVLNYLRIHEIFLIVIVVTVKFEDRGPGSGFSVYILPDYVRKAEAANAFWHTRHRNGRQM